MSVRIRLTGGPRDGDTFTRPDAPSAWLAHDPAAPSRRGIYQPRTTGTVRIDPGGTVHVDNPGIATDDDGALIFDWQGYTS